MSVESYVSPAIQSAAREQADSVLEFHRRDASARGMTDAQAVEAALGETLEELFSAERDLSAGTAKASPDEVQALRMQAALIDRELGGRVPSWGTGSSAELPELFALRRARVAVDREFVELARANGSYTKGRSAWDATLADHVARRDEARRGLEQSRAFVASATRQSLCDYWSYRFRMESGLVDAIESVVRSEPERVRKLTDAERIARELGIEDTVSQSIRHAKDSVVSFGSYVRALEDDPSSSTDAMMRRYLERLRFIERLARPRVVGAEEVTERMEERGGVTLVSPSEGGAPEDTLVPVPDRFDMLSDALKEVQRRVDREYAAIAGRAGSFDDARGRESWNEAVRVHEGRERVARAALDAVRAARPIDEEAERERMSEFRFESNLADALRSFVRRESDRLNRERESADIRELPMTAMEPLDAPTRPGFFARAGNAVRRFTGTVARMAGFLALTSFNPASHQEAEPVPEPQAVSVSVSEGPAKTTESKDGPAERRLVERHGETAWGEADRLLREQKVRPTNERLVLLTQVILDDTGLTAKTAKKIRENETTLVVGNAKALARRMADGTSTKELAQANGYAWPMALK
ncbi:hypothetical protein EBS80_01040 [bacterium]|nr:hypothetical protein [bacterium]